MNKAELRRFYLAKQKTISAEDRSRASRQIAARLFDSFDLARIEFLHIFLSIEKFNEVDTWLIIEKLWREFPHVQTVVPRVDFKTNEITNLLFRADTALTRNSWGIDEPSHDEFVAAEKIDLVLVPGLCFDRQGHRVGYGKGYYDSFLAKCRPDCVKVGLSHFEPVGAIGDTTDHDVRLDFVVRPDAVHRPAPLA